MKRKLEKVKMKKEIKYQHLIKYANNKCIKLYSNLKSFITNLPKKLKLLVFLTLII